MLFFQGRPHPTLFPHRNDAVGKSLLDTNGHQRGENSPKRHPNEVAPDSSGYCPTVQQGAPQFQFVLIRVHSWFNRIVPAIERACGRNLVVVLRSVGRGLSHLLFSDRDRNATGVGRRRDKGSIGCAQTGFDSSVADGWGGCAEASGAGDSSMLAFCWRNSMVFSLASWS